MARVAVTGAAGRMGRTVCAALDGEPGLELVAAVDPGAAGRSLGDLVPGLGPRAAGIVIAAEPAGIAGSAVDVLVDFSRADGAIAALTWCAANGVHGVCGTTGLDQSDLDRLRERFDGSGANCVVAPNFSISAALLLRLAELAAAHLPGVEVVELHHDEKRDAPSGTAIETARRIAAARAAAGIGEPSDPTVDHVLAGARGAAGPGGIRIHAVRLPGLVAHEEVVFGATGQSLTIRQDSYDRSSFMPGVLVAVRRVPELPGLTYGLDAVLGL